MSKKVKSINKLVATMIIVVIGAFIVLFNSKNGKVDKIDSLDESCMLVNDSTSISDTIVKSFDSTTFNITLSVKDTMVSDTSSLMKSFYKK